MSQLRTIIQLFVQDESGQDLIEYALVTGILGPGAVASMQSLATKTNAAFASIGTTLTSNV